MKLLIGLSCLLLSTTSFSTTLNLGRGIDLYTINGKKVESSTEDSYEIPTGKNQISVQFAAKLSNGAKSEYLNTKPYLININVQSETELELSLVSQKYKTIDKLAYSGSAIYQLDVDGREEQLEQFILPSEVKLFPYGNMHAVVTAYNRKNGIAFSSAGAENLTEKAVKIEKNGKITISGDALAQLKLWYSKATEYEIEQFESWVQTQK